MNVNAKMIGSL